MKAQPKPLDFGGNGINGSVDAYGRIIALNFYHHKHGYATLTSAPPFDESKRYDPSAVRAYRAALANLEGFGINPSVPLEPVSATSDGICVRQELAGESARCSVVTYVAGGIVVQHWEAEGCTLSFSENYQLMRCAYTQLTEGGPLPMPPIETSSDRFLDCWRIRNEAIGAVIVRGYPREPVNHATIEFAFCEEDRGGPAYFHLQRTLTPALERVSRRWDAWWAAVPADPLLRRGLSYGYHMAVPVDDTTCLLTDHMLLPLSWNRDAYYVALALLHWPGRPAEMREIVRRHLLWMFERADRPDGAWGRCYLANGRIKDPAFQLDQQLFPLLELTDYMLMTGDRVTFARLKPVVQQVLDMLMARRAPDAALFPTDETPADDPIALPYHLSSHILFWKVLDRLDQLGMPVRGMADEIRAAVTRYFSTNLDGATVWAYATDGHGGMHLYHDANDFPTVLAPAWGFCSADDPVWRATMEFAFSDANKDGVYNGRLGSVHTRAPWPLGDVQDMLVARALGDAAREAAAVARLRHAAQPDGSLPEASDPETGAVASRAWFAWPNAAYACTVLNAFSPREEMPVNIDAHARIREKLTTLYGADLAVGTYAALEPLLAPVSPGKSGNLPLSEKDVMLIAYGDHVRREGEAPLRTLNNLLHTLYRDSPPVSSLHILPFYPWSSDDGFSVIDYFQVDPALGTWDDVRQIGRRYRLMFDAVFNHISAGSDWFQAFLRGEAPYDAYFVALPEGTDVSLVTRPRTHPLLTPFETASGTRHVWTTFSADQIDLNAANPDVLVALTRALRFYVEQGAQYIRLDAIAFLWKIVGTTSIHLPETHLIIQLWRDVLDIIAPDVMLITETNVPHVENISYFGDGTDEAQMVYNFALPPLVLHTLATGDAGHLSAWAKTITRVSDRSTFFNFTASHDGIGLRPVQDILSADEVAALVARTLAHGGHVSMKNNSDGTQSPYEMNITWFDAITAPEVTAERPDIAIDRFMVSQAIMLAMLGVPGIYFHSLFGSRNDHAGVEATGRFRSINREKLDADALLKELQTPGTFRYNVHLRYRHLLLVRTLEPAFHPLGMQTVHDVHPGLFVLERISPNGRERMLAVHNVTGDTIVVALPGEGRWTDTLNGAVVEMGQPLRVAPYQVMWLSPSGRHHYLSENPGRPPTIISNVTGLDDAMQ
ncbi:MAG: glycoside hydrolase family 125 protein [Pleurocapsa minor GSE-CHR-MK-17-07R]|jgi:sucrose phosphorylase|nr:glycoside hydrolase family 125 protein [Pleurocapsa minor GSE-CHR-MK 17-07R]